MLILTKGISSMKRVLCVLLTLFVAVSSMPIAGAASNNSDDEFCIYFDASGWQNTNNIRCYMGEIGNAQFGWLKGERVQNSVYAFELSNYKDYKIISRGFLNGSNFVIFFEDNNGMRTCDITIGKTCVGDTLKLTGNTTKNPVDISKINYDAFWTNNNDKYGSHLAIASDGDIIGSYLCPHESKAAFIGDWLSYYYNDFEVDAVADVVSNAMKKLKYYNTDEIYKHIYTTKGSVNLLIDLILYKAEYNTCGVVSLDKEKATLYIGDTYKLPITKGGNYKKITYKSKNTRIVTVTNAGKITAKKAGTAKIEIKTPYITKSFTVTVRKPSINLKKKSLLMTVKEKSKISYNAMPKKGFKISWKSSEPKIVKVTSKGVVKAVRQGISYITVTMKYKGKSYISKCKVISLKL